MNTKKIALVYVTYDGAINSTCGVGVLSQYFINAFPSVYNATLKKQGIELSLNVIAVKLNKTAHGYSSIIKKTTYEMCSKYGGELFYIDNGTNGNENYGIVNNWQIASYNASENLYKLSKKYDHLLVYLVDTPFLGVPNVANSIFNIENVTYIIVPHSDVFSHFPDKLNSERYRWEKAAFLGLKKDDKTYLAGTSNFLLQTLVSNYKIKNNKIISLQTGLIPTNQRFKPASNKDIIKSLRNYHIPLNKNLIFSVGRAVPYKGFEDLIISYKFLLCQRSDVHLVFIASPFRNSPSNVETLKELIDNNDLNDFVTSIYDLDMELPRLICQWEKTKIVAQLSHREPFGLVPEETRLWAGKHGPIVVASNLDGFKEQIDNNKDGFLVLPNEHKHISNIFQYILSMDDQKIKQICTSGKKRCLKDYDYSKSVVKSVNALLEAI